MDELFAPTDPPKEADLKNTAETPKPNAVESILARLPPEGQAWLNGLNPFCRWAVEYDLRTAPDSFVKHWEYLRDALQKSKTISVLPITGSSLSHQSVGRPPP